MDGTCFRVCGALVGGLIWVLVMPPLLRAQTVQFTVDPGISYLHWDETVPPPPEFFGVEISMMRMAGGAAAGDYDGINGPDLYATRIGAPNLLFRNAGDGTFEEVGDQAGVAVNGFSSGCAWADVNNDGHLDLYVVTFSRGGLNSLFINDGIGKFTDEATARGVDMSSRGVRALASAAFGDYNLDGALDLFVTEWLPGFTDQNRLFLNDGTGHFQDVTMQAGVFVQEFAGFAPGFADMDEDGWPELLVAGDFKTSQLFRNLRDGTFENITRPALVGTDENGMGSTIGDCDGDGLLDWFVTSIFDPDRTCEVIACNWGYTGNRLFLNRLNSVSQFLDFTRQAGVRDGGWGWGTSFLDFDNDGDLDLGMTNGIVFRGEADDQFNADPLKLWENDGSGNFTEVSVETQFTDNGSGKGFVVFDYDQDGDQDVFIVNNAGQPVLFRNDGGNTNDWLRVSLLGHTTNTFGIGARVTVQATPDGPFQVQEMHANSNYMSQNETVLHFGFGNDVETLHSVRVSWPASGFEQELTDVPTNQLLVIDEPRRVFIRGDANDDSSVNLADPLRVLNTLFGQQSILCYDAAEVNGSDVIDLSDAVYLLNGLFASGALPLPPYPNCGVNSGDRDNCREYNSCSR